jgi:hypothetical protein
MMAAATVLNALSARGAGGWRDWKLVNAWLINGSLSEKDAVADPGKPWSSSASLLSVRERTLPNPSKQQRGGQ